MHHIPLSHAPLYSDTGTESRTGATLKVAAEPIAPSVLETEPENAWLYLYYSTHPSPSWHAPTNRASLTPETEGLLVGPLKMVMEHISEAFNQPRKIRTGGTSRTTERMVWGKEGLGSWVALLAEQVIYSYVHGPLHRLDGVWHEGLGTRSRWRCLDALL